MVSKALLKFVRQDRDIIVNPLILERHNVKPHPFISICLHHVISQSYICSEEKITHPIP